MSCSSPAGSTDTTSNALYIDRERVPEALSFTDRLGGETVHVDAHLAAGGEVDEVTMTNIAQTVNVL